MYFTEEDYKNIEKWLQHRAIKDSQLYCAKPLTGDEQVAILQEGVNKKVNIHQIAEKCSESYFDFYNVTERHKVFNLTLREAISYVPINIRKPGLVVTFLDKDNFWRVVQYEGTVKGHWDYENHWKDVKELPDDIKDTDQDITWGKKRKVLKLNVQVVPEPDGSETMEINPLEQSDFDQEDTVYIIRYNFDIRSRIILPEVRDNVTIPSNCEIRFEGGKLKLWENSLLDLNGAKITGVVGDIADYIIQEDGSRVINYAEGQLNYTDRLEIYTGSEWKKLTPQNSQEIETKLICDIIYELEKNTSVRPYVYKRIGSPEIRNCRIIPKSSKVVYTSTPDENNKMETITAKHTGVVLEYLTTDEFTKLGGTPINVKDLELGATIAG